MLAIATAATLLASAYAGCGSGRRGAALPDALRGSDEEAQVQYWLAIEQRDVVSYDEAFRGLMLYRDPGFAAPDYPSLVAEMTRQRMLPPGFDEPADAPARRGVLAVPIARMLDIRGGLALRISGGASSRYALRELVYRGVYPPSGEWQTFTGVEFTGLMGQLEEMQPETAGATP